MGRAAERGGGTGGAGTGPSVPQPQAVVLLLRLGGVSGDPGKHKGGVRAHPGTQDRYSPDRAQLRALPSGTLEPSSQSCSPNFPP